MAIAVIFPSLKGFFHGRNLDNEARQFLSLTRYGQSRAIAEGIPVELWINPRQETYGLQALSGYSETQTNPMVFAVDKTVQIAFSAPPSVLTRSNQSDPAVGPRRRPDQDSVSAGRFHQRHQPGEHFFSGAGRGG